MITFYPIDNVNEIEVLELLKNSKGIYWKELYLEDLPFYAILAIARDLEKRGFTTNNNGIIDITEQGKDYLIKLLN
jgi:predicted methyltransferase